MVYLSKVRLEEAELPLSLCKRVTLIADGMSEQAELFLNMLDYYQRWVQLELKTKLGINMIHYPCKIQSIMLEHDPNFLKLEDVLSLLVS